MSSRLIPLLIVLCLGILALSCRISSSELGTPTVDVSPSSIPSPIKPVGGGVPPATLTITPEIPPGTPTPGLTFTPTMINTSGSMFAPILDAGTGYLLGASRDHLWLDADRAAAHIHGHERYDMFADSLYLRDATGTIAFPIESPGPCAGNYFVTLDPAPYVTPAVAIAGNWNVTPRLPVELSPHIQVYKDVVADLLLQQGIEEPQVQLSEVLQIDLEGDGINEVLITANHILDGVFPPVEAGDYSLVMLRKIVAGDVISLPLVVEVYPQAEELAYPYVHTVVGVLDLNDDGSLEVVVHGARWEGMRMLIFEIEGGDIHIVLSVTCTL